MTRHRRARAKRRQKVVKATAKPGTLSSAAVLTLVPPAKAAAPPRTPAPNPVPAPALFVVAAPGASGGVAPSEGQAEAGADIVEAPSVAPTAENPAEDSAENVDPFEPIISPHRRHRATLDARRLLYVGIALMVALFVFAVLSMMEQRDLAPRLIPVP